jgi:hypothetical protein
VTTHCSRDLNYRPAIASEDAARVCGGRTDPVETAPDSTGNRFDARVFGATSEGCGVNSIQSEARSSRRLLEAAADRGYAFEQLAVSACAQARIVRKNVRSTNPPFGLAPCTERAGSSRSPKSDCTALAPVKSSFAV